MQVVGIICLLCGIMHQILNRNHLNILNHDIINVPVILLIYGFSLSTISSLGILGAALRHTGVMRCYVFIIVNILIVKAALCLWFYQCIEEVSGIDKPSMSSSLFTFQVDFDIVQLYLKVTCPFPDHLTII